VPVELTNSIGMKLVLIPPGEFQMGSPKELIEEELKAHAGNDWWMEHLPGEGPRHRVRITKPFYLGTYLVTQEEYQRVVGTNPSEHSATGKHKDYVIGQDTKRFPVEQVSWDDALEFCRQLSNLPEEKAAGRWYRLPSEAQWEYACRAGSTGRYGFSSLRNVISREYEEKTLSDYAWIADNASGVPRAVGLKRAGAWGLYDMHGNVAQWCQDWYDKGYYAKSPTDDPTGPVAGSDRVSRGGGSCRPARRCRSAARYNGLGDRLNGLGFRAALVLPDAAAERAKMIRTADAAQPSGGSTAEKPSPTPPIPNPQSPIPPAVGSLIGADGQWNLPPGAPPPAVAPFDEKKAKEHQEGWAKHLRVPVEMTNSIGMKLVLIPPGEFEMGSPKEIIEEEFKACAYDNWYVEHLPSEGPRHRVRVTQPFYLGIYHVTQAEYERVMGTNPSEFSATGTGKDKVGGQDTKRFPVERVSWDDAVEFCRKLSALPEEKAAGRWYQLPTEAQWEYACRAGTTGRYSFSPLGRVIPREYDEHESPDHGWFNGNSAGMPHPVGLKGANAWGLFGMQGNVWQWCQDWWDKGYYANSPVDDPVGPSAGEGRVFRGGTWNYGAENCRSACRHSDAPGERRGDRGFRACLVRAENFEERKIVPSAEPSSRSTKPPAPIPNPESPTPPLAIAPFDAAKAKEHQAAWAKYLNTPVEITNSIRMKLVLIPPGEFEMGSPKEIIEKELKAHAGEDWNLGYVERLPSEGPRHRVRITQPFYLGVYHVTQAEYQRVMGVDPSEFSATGKGKDKVAGQDTKRFPVECVSWDDAVEFCRTLSGLPEEKAAGRWYQLPTEAQWEYACRAGTTGRYSFSPLGRAIPREDDEHELLDHGWFDGNSGRVPHAVGLKRANAWGLFDMHGSVYQWCQDWWDKGYYGASPVDDPVGPPGGGWRVCRGGSWLPMAGNCRSAYRGSNGPENRFNDHGFRACLVRAEKWNTSAEQDRAPVPGPAFRAGAKP
jgi:formylglycine-generating enzyme required for sulfatase activity